MTKPVKPDYDFAKWEGGRSLKGAMLRARMFDRYVEDFLAAHPRGTVVEIGCGLDTRFDRVDNGRVRRFDLDLPDAIALRRRFFDDEPRRTMVAASVLDSSWMDAVAATGGPWIFVAEAVLIYLDAPQARRAIAEIAQRFPGARIAFDTTGRPARDRVVGREPPARGVEDVSRRRPRPPGSTAAAARLTAGQRKRHHDETWPLVDGLPAGLADARPRAGPGQSPARWPTRPAACCRA